MASSRRNYSKQDEPLFSDVERELFESCRNGDLSKVKKLINAQNVNSKDTEGRKSSPLHFAAGKFATFKIRDIKL